MKKKIIIGAVFAAFLMLVTPCISAVNNQVIKETYQENLSYGDITDILEELALYLGTLDPDVSPSFVILALIIMIIITFIINIIEFMGKLIGTIVLATVGLIVEVSELLADLFNRLVDGIIGIYEMIVTILVAILNAITPP